jgi:ribosomal-protein-alanine N-acetyltransferase
MKGIEIVTANREHIDDIVVVENLSFKIPWSRQSIMEELLENKMAVYFCALVGREADEGEKAGGGRDAGYTADYGAARVAECSAEGTYAAGPDDGTGAGSNGGNVRGKAVGYAGMWQVMDEGHITNIAVHPEFRNYGVGSALMEALLATARSRGIVALTLEVRRSNFAAQALYRKYGFAEGGMRKAYYADNREDALIMWKRLDTE